MRRSRDFVVVAAIGLLLSLGVTGELSGARTPDEFALYPVHGPLLDALVASRDCRFIDWALESPELSLTVGNRAYRERLEAARDEIGCPAPGRTMGCPALSHPAVIVEPCTRR